MLAVEKLARAALGQFMRTFRTKLGNIQILDLNGSHAILRILTHQGFQQAFLKTFSEVSADDDSACGRALRSRSTVVIPAIDLDEGFAPYRDVARDAGYRGVISCPVVSTWGHTVGVMSTHFSNPWQPSAAC